MDDEGGWRRRFKGRVELIRHIDGRLEAVVQLYSQPRPADSGLATARRNVAAMDAANQATPATLGQSDAPHEQILFLSTVDPAVHLLLRVVANRDDAAASLCRVTVEARSGRLPHLYAPGNLDIRLSAAGQPFAHRAPAPLGYRFDAVPIAALGDLRIEVSAALE